MNKIVMASLFAAGLAVVAWVGWGFVGSSSLALVMTVVIEDDKVGGDDLEELIMKYEDHVQSVDGGEQVEEGVGRVRGQKVAGRIELPPRQELPREEGEGEPTASDLAARST